MKYEYKLEELASSVDTESDFYTLWVPLQSTSTLVVKYKVLFDRGHCNSSSFEKRHYNSPKICHYNFISSPSMPFSTDAVYKTHYQASEVALHSRRSFACRPPWARAAAPPWFRLPLNENLSDPRDRNGFREFRRFSTNFSLKNSQTYLNFHMRLDKINPNFEQ